MAKTTASQAMGQAIALMYTVQQKLTHSASCCAEGTLELSLEIDEMVEQAKELTGRLEALLGGVERFDEEKNKDK